MAGEKAADRAVANCYAFVREPLAQLFDRDVGRLFDKSEDGVLVRLDPSGSAVSAQRSGACFASLARERSPPADARGADSEPFARPPMAQALRHRGQKTPTRRSSDRALGMSAGLHPAHSLNHLNRDSGI